MPLIVRAGPNCVHSPEWQEPLEGTQFMECTACHAILDGTDVVLKQPDVDKIRARKYVEEVQEGLIVRAERFDRGWDVGYDAPTGFGSGLVLMDESNPDGIELHEGDGLRVVAVRASYLKGIYVQPKDTDEWLCVYHYDDDEFNERDVTAAIESNRKKARDFATEKPELDKLYDALPPVMQRRIDKYRRNNPSFRIEYEGYEAMVCRDAVLVAESMRPEMETMLALAPDKLAEVIHGDDEEQRAAFLFRFADTQDPDAYLRNAVAWKLVGDYNAKPWDEQKKLGVDEGHSGNSFGMVCRLAWLFLAGRDDDLVSHYGALAPLVGSPEYGDDVTEEEPDPNAVEV